LRQGFQPLADWRTRGLAGWRTGGLADSRAGGLADSRAGGLADSRTRGLADGRLKLTPRNNFVSLQNQDTTQLFPYKIRLYTRGKGPDLSPARDSAACHKKRFQPLIIISKKKKKKNQNLPARLAIINPS
jgi:hypothetical protein